MNVYEKLLEVQAELKCNKSHYNSFGKYSYRNSEDILEAVKPLLKKNKATLLLQDYVKCIEGRFYVEAVATFVDIETGEKIETSAYAREDETKKGMDLAQVTGSVSSYARKYALNGLFCIDDTKDSDETNHTPKEEKSTVAQIKEKAKANVNKNEELISVQQARNLLILSGNDKDLCLEVVNSYGYSGAAQVKQKDYDDIYVAIQNAAITKDREPKIVING